MSDAHTLEGGKFLRYLKPLLTGTYLHQSLEDTMLYIEENVLGRGTVYFDFSRRKLDILNREISLMHKEIRDELAMKCEIPPWL